MTSSLTLAARLQLEAGQWARALSGAQTKTRRFVSGVRNEFDHLRSFAQSTTAVLAQIGVGITVADQVMKSARLDQSLTRIGQSAGASRKMIDEMRGSLMRMAQETGNSVEDLQAGLDVLIAGNLDPSKAVATLGAINKASRVTQASQETLASALMVLNTNFKINLNDGDAVTAMLEKMTVAGRKGFLELNSLADVIPRIAQPAKSAGMSDTGMFAFLETLSNAEQDPSRLATLAESTLRIFNNPQYRKQVQKATGVKFVDEKDELRPVSAIFSDLQDKYSRLKTGGQRQRFAGDVFGQMDITTQTGVMSMLDQGMLGTMADIQRAIAESGGTFDRDMAGAMNNAVAQVGVLKSKLREAADGFAQPINAALTASIKQLTGEKKDGGWDLSGGQLVAGGSLAIAGLYGASRVMKGPVAGWLQKITGGSGNIAAGAAAGTVMKEAGLADARVYIVGAAPGVFSGNGLAGSGAAALSATTGKRLAKVVTGVLPAAFAGWEIGTWLREQSLKTEAGRKQDEDLGRSIAKGLAFLGYKPARDALANEQRAMKLEIDVRTDGGASARVRPDFSDVRNGATARIRTGRMLDRPGRE